MNRPPASLSRRAYRAWAWPLACAAAAVAGCSKPPQAPASIPRPVTVIKLAKTNPTRRLRLTGSAEAWKQEKIGFEVGGRVEWVIDEGVEIQGRTVDENGKLLTPGTVLARLDSKRYALQVASAQAQQLATQAQAAATKIEIERVLAQQLKAAQAALDRAAKEYQRSKKLAQTGAGTETELDRNEAEFKMAQARVEQIQATTSAKGAELNSMLAQARQAGEMVKQAKLDLQSCALVSCFHGRVAKVHIIPGAYVDPGDAIVTVVVMDPIKVQVAVSPATDRSTSYGDTVMVYPPGLDQAVAGWVYYKDTVADPATRTFTLTVIVRNRRTPVDLPLGATLPKLPRIADLTSPEVAMPGQPSPLFVDVNALMQDAQGCYVWKVDGLKLGQLKGKLDPVLTIRRVRVKPADARFAVPGMVFRALADAGSLQRDDVLALGVPKCVKDGDKVLFVRERWLFRPGDLVPVMLQNPGVGEGRYVPMEAIVHVDGRSNVFIVEDGPNGQRAKRVPVKLGGAVGELRAIEGPGIVDGARVILHGAHYLIPDEPVRVVQTQGAAS